MSFTAIIEDSAGQEIARCTRLGNERYLVRKDKNFPLLSNLNLASYDVFSSGQASALRDELLLLRDELDNGKERAHVEELAQLAQTSSEIGGSTITFTPFSR